MQAFGNRQDDALWRHLTARFGMPALLATPARVLDDVALPAAQIDERAHAAFVNLLGAERVRGDRAARLAAAPAQLAARLRQRAGDLSGTPDLVLCPDNEAELLATLRLCAEYDLAVGDTVALDLSGMNHILSCDAQSGLMDVEAGIGGSALARQLAARGMAARGLAANLAEGDEPGGWIAAAGRTGILRSVRMATPQGIWIADAGMPPRGPAGIMARVTLAVRAMPARRQRHHWLMRDFASGLAVARDAGRAGITGLVLSDAAETGLLRQMADAPQGLRAWLSALHWKVRGIGDGAALLYADVESEAAGRMLDALVLKQGGVSLERGKAEGWTGLARLNSLASALLERGAAMDSLSISANWSYLPQLCSRIRGALDETMTGHGPRMGAQALTLARISEPSLNGALLTVTWLYPRKLEDDVVQAGALRNAARQATHADVEDTLNAAIFQAIRDTVDPRGILGS